MAQRRRHLLTDTEHVVSHRRKARPRGGPGRCPSANNGAVIDALNQTWNAMIGEGGPFAFSDTEVRGMTMKTFDSAPPNLRLVWESSIAHGDKLVVSFAWRGGGGEGD